MSKRDIKLYLYDIFDSATAIKEFTKNLTYDEFVADRKTYSATIREYTIIGEAISKIIDILEEKIPEYPWRNIKDFRNFIVHEYFGVDAKIVWDLTTYELNEMIEKLKNINGS